MAVQRDVFAERSEVCAELPGLSAVGCWAGWRTRPQTFRPHISDDGARYAEAAELRSTDVVITTFPKTGTTWLQQICEMIRSGGDMGFSEITERQPWLDWAYDCGQDLGDDQLHSPRLFKSHQLLSAINPGAKYLSIVRDPAKTLKSWFYFQQAKGHRPYSDCAGPDDPACLRHFEGTNIFGTNLWDFYSELWAAREDPSVLVLCYEHLLADPGRLLPHIAAFLGVEVDAERVALVLRMSSSKFMAAHEGQFDDNFIERKGKELGRCKMVMAATTKVTPGHAPLQDTTTAWLEEQWTERVAARTGLQTYADMAAALAAPDAAGGGARKRKATDQD